MLTKEKFIERATALIRTFFHPEGVGYLLQFKHEIPNWYEAYLAYKCNKITNNKLAIDFFNQLDKSKSKWPEYLL